MDRENAKTRNKLRNIPALQDLDDLLKQVLLSEEEKQIVIMHYKEQKSLSYIAYALGMSESTVTRKHNKILRKIGKLF